VTDKGLDERVKLQGAQWLARQRSNLRTDEDARGFQAWLAEDPAHGEAFEALTAVWDVAGNYPRDMRGGTPAAASNSRRAVLAGLLAAPIAGTAAYLTLLRPAEARTYLTKVGEQRTVELPDNSRALLDTNSCMDTLFDRDTRIITLRYGRANFTVVSDKENRPFVVKAAEGRIVADTSNFDVRCDSRNASVMLFSGQASVNLNNEVRRLSPGERMALVGETVAAIDRPRAAAVGAWHSGRTVFEDTRLSEAVAEMNRYSPVGLALQGRDLGDKRISGVYRNGDSIAFANTVAALMGAKVQETPSRVTLIASDGRPLTKK
jgi:transmembrane sensor